MSSAPLYDTIGTTFALTRRTEPRVAEQVWAALGVASTVLDVGAGTGSYEPTDAMSRRRAVGGHACATARRLSAMRGRYRRAPPVLGPLLAAMAFATVHHWHDPIAGMREMRRVARRVVVLTCETTEGSWRSRFWLTPDYLPEVVASPVGLAGPLLGQPLSNERCAVSATTSHLAGGPNATTTCSLSTPSSSAFAWSSPEPGAIRER